MISALSSATIGIQRSQDQFDAAAATVANGIGADPGSDPVANSGDENGFESGMVSMMVAAFAFQASIRMAQTSTEMLMDALKLGNYGSAAPASA